MQNGNVKFYFSKANGYFEKVMRYDSLISLSDGPALAGFELKMDSFNLILWELLLITLKKILQPCNGLAAGLTMFGKTG